jgi:hypothetical protein
MVTKKPNLKLIKSGFVHIKGIEANWMGETTPTELLRKIQEILELRDQISL